MTISIYHNVKRNKMFSLFKKTNNGKHKEKKVHFTPPWRLPLIGKKKLTPDQQRELFQLNKWILDALKQDWKENNLK